MRKVFLVMLVVIAAFQFFTSYPDHQPRAQNVQQSLQGTTPVAKNINITGKVIKEADGYFIQGHTPSEIFRILNPIPNLLDKIVKSNRTVKIEARIVQGDNVAIEKINGQPYKEKERQEK